MDPRERVADKVKKLLAKAARTDFPAEASAFAVEAAKMFYDNDLDVIAPAPRQRSSARARAATPPPPPPVENPWADTYAPRHSWNLEPAPPWARCVMCQQNIEPGEFAWKRAGGADFVHDWYCS